MPPHLSLHLAPREKLADTVAKQLLERISKLPYGSRLPTVQQLAEAMGVSRLTVREALIQANRADLIGTGCDCLIPAQPPKEAIEARRRRANEAADAAR